MAFLEKREGSANEVQGAVIDLTNYKKRGIVALTATLAPYQEPKAI
jgi:hypothetical protein